MIKSIITSVVVSTIGATVLSADTAKISRDGMGDFLIAPVYIAKDNICSNVTVFNTNEKKSILAKVAFRESISSQEVDLPIFLSPGDVWDGRVCGTSSGVVLTSLDDSNHPAVKDELALGKNLTVHSMNAGHKNIDFSKGYIEIYPIAQFDERSTRKVNKNVLVQRWDALTRGDTSNPKLIETGLDSYSLSGIVSYDINYFETSSLPMLAFKGVHDRQVSGSAIAYGNDTNPDLLLGKDKTKQILKELQDKVTSFTYNNGGLNQFINLTFPFGYSDNQVRTYQVTVRDMSENKDIVADEVRIFSPKPVEQVIVKMVKREVASISVKEIISLTQNPMNFTSGMIQIKDITNNTDVQLGKGKLASFIPVKIKYGSVALGKNNRTATVNNVMYIPSK